MQNLPAIVIFLKTVVAVNLLRSFEFLHMKRYRPGSKTDRILRMVHGQNLRNAVVTPCVSSVRTRDNQIVTSPQTAISMRSQSPPVIQAKQLCRGVVNDGPYTHAILVETSDYRTTDRVKEIPGLHQVRASEPVFHTSIARKRPA